VGSCLRLPAAGSGSECDLADGGRRRQCAERGPASPDERIEIAAVVALRVVPVVVDRAGVRRDRGCQRPVQLQAVENWILDWLLGESVEVVERHLECNGRPHNGGNVNQRHEGREDGGRLRVEALVAQLLERTAPQDRIRNRTGTTLPHAQFVSGSRDDCQAVAREAIDQGGGVGTGGEARTSEIRHGYVAVRRPCHFWCAYSWSPRRGWT
jgi:hypothetical protein